MGQKISGHYFQPVASLNETALGPHVYQKGPPNRGGVGCHGGVGCDMQGCGGSWRGGVGHGWVGWGGLCHGGVEWGV